MERDSSPSDRANWIDFTTEVTEVTENCLTLCSSPCLCDLCGSIRSYGLPDFDVHSMRHCFTTHPESDRSTPNV